MKAVINDRVIGTEEVEEAVPAEMIHVKIDQKLLHEEFAKKQGAVQLVVE